MSNNFVFNDLEIDNGINILNKTLTDSNDSKQKTIENFKDLKDSGLFSEGIDVIGNKMTNVSYGISSVKQLINYSKTKTVELEQSLSSKADEIDVPLDFVVNDNRKDISIDDVRLSKKDGTSVKEGKASQEQEYDDESKVASKELVNILGESSNEISDQVNVEVKETLLSNIKSDEEQIEKSVEDNYDTEKAILGNINKEVEQEEKSLDDNSSIQEQSLNNIENKSRQQEVKLEDNYGIVANNNQVNNSLGSFAQSNDSNLDYSLDSDDKSSVKESSITDDDKKEDQEEKEEQKDDWRDSYGN